MEAPAWLRPLLDALPPDAQNFLNAGGWLLIPGVGGLIGLLVLLAFVRRLLRAARRQRPRAEPVLTENLSTYPPPPALLGDPLLTVYGLPVRLRLLVLAPLGYEAGDVRSNDVEWLLEQVVPGIGHVARWDKPRVRTWPTQLSYQGFTAAFRRHTVIPEEHGPSRWVLLMGRVLVNRRPLALGIALLANQDNTLGRIVFDQPHQWMEALRIKQAT